MRIEIDQTGYDALTGDPPPQFQVCAVAGMTTYLLGAHQHRAAAVQHLSDLRLVFGTEPRTVCSPIRSGRCFLVHEYGWKNGRQNYKAGFVYIRPLRKGH